MKTPLPSERVIQAIERYTRTLKGLRTTQQITMPVIATLSLRADRTFEKFIKDNSIEEAETETSKTFTVPFEKHSSFNRLHKRAEALDVAYQQLPRALMVSLVSAYDAFLSDLLRAALYLKPELLNGSQRQLTFKQLAEFASIDAAREHITEKEVESVIRSSHTDHFDWMEDRFAVTLRKGLDCWPAFVELTERRNLFVHCNGTVSSQYLEVCEKHQAGTNGAKVGDVLEVDQQYFSDSWTCLFEIGVKLAHVVWRKLAPSSIDESDSALIDLSYDLLHDRDFTLAAKILEFAVHGFPRHASALNKRVLLINLCIALKFSNRNADCLAVLNAQDFSDADQSFRLAESVLKDDFARAAELMSALGPNSKAVPRHAYENWPLFNEFRKTPEFRATFRTLFGEDFIVEDKKPAVSPELANAEKEQLSATLGAQGVRPTQREGTDGNEPITGT